MKRTATTMVLLAGFGGGCATPSDLTGSRPGQPGGFGTVSRAKEIPNVQGPTGEPVAMMARGAMPGGQQAGGGRPAGSPGTLFGGKSGGVQPAGYASVGGGSGVTVAHLPGQSAMSSGVVQASGFGPGSGNPPHPNAGILPVPGMGPPGAVAAVGAIMPGMAPPVVNQRTSIRFTGPAGMKITWQLPGGAFNDEGTGLTAPKEYNFMQGQVYRLRLSQILPNYPGRTFYPTLEVVPANPKTVTFLAHSSVPVTFTNEDFDQVVAGNLVVKVIYLPDPAYQDFALVAGAAEEIVSTRLEPGADPIAEAQRRGSILAIIRLGNIDLENRSSPAMNAPPGGMMMPPGFPMVPPGVQMLPPGAVPPPGAPVPAPPGVTVPPPPGFPPGAQLTPRGPVAPPATAAPPVAAPVPPGGPVAPGPLPPTVGGGATSSARPAALPPTK